MIIQSPGEIVFYIFKMPVYWYGIILAIGIFVGIMTAYKLFAKFYDENHAEKIIDMSPYVIIAGIVGARLYYCLMNAPYYFAHPLEIFYIREGGQSIHGMIIMGALCLFYFSKRYKIDYKKVFDVYLCGTALAQSIGRWGNFFNSEAFGLPYDGFLKLYIPISSRPLKYIDYAYFHPTFLYESVLDLIVFIILLLNFKKLSQKSGLISGMYLVLYGIVRLFVEQLRIDSALNIYGIPVAQIVSIVLIVIGMMIVFSRSLTPMEKNN